MTRVQGGPGEGMVQSVYTEPSEKFEIFFVMSCKVKKTWCMKKTTKYIFSNSFFSIMWLFGLSRKLETNTFESSISKGTINDFSNGFQYDIGKLGRIHDSFY